MTSMAPSARWKVDPLPLELWRQQPPGRPGWRPESWSSRPTGREAQWWAVLAPAHGVDEELLDPEKWGVHSDLTGACGWFYSWVSCFSLIFLLLLQSLENGQFSKMLHLYNSVLRWMCCCLIFPFSAQSPWSWSEVWCGRGVQSWPLTQIPDFTARPGLQQLRPWAK